MCIRDRSVALVGFLMFGNLLRECGVLGSLSQTAQNEFANIITLLLGITISFSMRAEQFVNPATLMIKMCIRDRVYTVPGTASPDSGYTGS